MNYPPAKFIPTNLRQSGLRLVRFKEASVSSAMGFFRKTLPVVPTVLHTQDMLLKTYDLNIIYIF
jgi:hypothetical protein